MCIYIYIYTHIGMYIHLSLSLSLYIYIYIHIRVCVYIYIYIHIYTYVILKPNVIVSSQKQRKQVSSQKKRVIAHYGPCLPMIILCMLYASNQQSNKCSVSCMLRRRCLSYRRRTWSSASSWGCGFWSTLPTAGLDYAILCYTILDCTILNYSIL